MDSIYEKINKRKYDELSGMAGMKTDKKGRFLLTPKADVLEIHDKKMTTDIDLLEKKLQQIKQDKAKNESRLEIALEKEGKQKSKKKEKKKKKTLLKMVFNDAEIKKNTEGDDPDVGEYSEKKEKKKREKDKKVEGTTLDTGVGQRFSPIVVMLHETITEFDEIAKELQDELNKKSLSGMYKSSQTANLISAKTAKLRAVTEMGSIAKTITDIEMKKAKEEGKGENDTTKAINTFGIKMLRGGFDSDDVIKGSKSDKKKKKKKLIEDDDDDDDFYKSKRSNDLDLAKELASKISNGKDKFGFTAHELHIEMEGKYSFIVVADPADLEDSWKFVAVDKKGNKIPDFKDEYPGLMPKRKNCRMTFDMSKMQATDKNHGNKKYRLVLKD